MNKSVQDMEMKKKDLKSLDVICSEYKHSLKTLINLLEQQLVHE